jgi:hypothetical protein
LKEWQIGEYIYNTLINAIDLLFYKKKREKAKERKRKSTD